MGIRQDEATGIYQIDIRVAGLPRFQRSSFTKSRKAAQELHDKIKKEMWDQSKLGVKPKRVWTELVDLWVRTKTQEGKRSLDDDRDKLRWLHQHFDNGRTLLDDVTIEFIDAVLDKKVAEGKLHATRDGMIRRELSTSTLNRYRSLIKSMLNLAHKRGWISEVPHIEKAEEGTRRPRYISMEQAADLIREMPEKYRYLVMFSLLTGIRQSNACQLLWKDVDLRQGTMHIWADDAKGKADILVPLNSQAVALLKSVLGTVKSNSTYVFPDPDTGEPFIYPASKAFKSACRRANLPDQFRWHDLRHTWASWHVQNGTPLQVLKELGGWKSLDMVLIYAHFAPTHLARYSANVALPPIAEKIKAAPSNSQNVGEHLVNR